MEIIETKNTIKPLSFHMVPIIFRPSIHCWSTWRAEIHTYLKVQFLNLIRFKVRVSDFDRVTGLPRSISIFLKNQNDVVLVKKKVNGFLTGFFGSTRRVTPGHEFSYFLFNSDQFQHRIDRVPGQVRFQKTMIESFEFCFFLYRRERQ